jgi:hypothetical protein
MESALTLPFDSKTTMKYRCKSLVELLIWHEHGASTNGLIWILGVGITSEKWLEFGTEP